MPTPLWACAPVFPAWAGVDLSIRIIRIIIAGIPRVGGGRPFPAAMMMRMMRYSPRGRG